MTQNATFKILITYETCESFAAIIRSQEMSERGTLQLESEFDTGSASGNPTCATLSALRREREQAASKEALSQYARAVAGNESIFERSATAKMAARPDETSA